MLKGKNDQLSRVSLRGKKGQDKLISVYWFAILMIVAGGIFAMVSLFYSSPYDVRDMEVQILSEKVADCIYSGGEMNKRLFSGGFREEFRDNFLERCSLTFDKKGEYEEDAYYVEVQFFKEGNLVKPVFNMSAGNKNWVPDCALAEENKYEKIVKCSKNKFYARTEGKNYLINMTTIVRKTEENVK